MTTSVEPAAPSAQSARADEPAGNGAAQAQGGDQEPRGDGEAPAFGERSRRRNRRERRRGGDRDGERAPARALNLPPNFEGPLPRHLQPVEPVAPVEAGEVFAQVLSGEFDEAVAEVEEAAEEPGKRILAPEPDAPKLHKVLAQAGVGSRRDMEELIADGKITVNGEPAHTGQRISFGDRVEVNGKPVRLRIVPPPARIIAYHKPAGEIVTHDDPQHRPTVFRRLPRLQQGKWQSVGRLDINTEGLL
ncbi:MAG: S4 domain-containing protein, partial [Caldimonas sp.]